MAPVDAGSPSAPCFRVDTALDHEVGPNGSQFADGGNHEHGTPSLLPARLRCGSTTSRPSPPSQATLVVAIGTSTSDCNSCGITFRQPTLPFPTSQPTIIQRMAAPRPWIEPSKLYRRGVCLAGQWRRLKWLNGHLCLSCHRRLLKWGSIRI